MSRVEDLGGRLPLLAPQKLTPEQNKLYQHIDGKLVPWADEAGFVGKIAGGYLVGPFNPFLYSPKIATGFLAFMQAEAENTTLSKTVREVVILTVGATWNSEYELYAHSAVARQAGLSSEVIAALVAGETPAGLSHSELTAHRFAQSLVQRYGVDEQLYKEAGEVFGKQGLVEITFLLGLYLYTCVTLNAFCVPVPTAEVSRAEEVV